MPSSSTRRRGLALCAGLLCAAALWPAQAQDFPSRAIRFIVPIGAGSGSDTITRLAARLVAAQLGQPTFVENRPGGDTVIAVQALLNAPADGYSVLMISPSSVVINPVVTDKLPYDAQRDLRPLAGALRSAAMLVTGSGSAFKHFGDVITAARKRPKSVSLASYGQHYRLGGLMLQQLAGVEFNPVSYKSPSQVQTDLIGGTVDLALLDIGGALPLITAGKLRALAVTGRDRHAQLPAVPTVRESGLPDYELSVWIGFGVHAKTPEPIAQKLESALLEAMKQPEFRRYVTETAGAELFPASGKALAELIAAETERYRQLGKRVNLVQP